MSGFAICFFRQLVLQTLLLYFSNMPFKSAFNAIFTEKNYDDKNTFEIFYLHFEFYCVQNDFYSVCIVNKRSKRDTLSF